MIPPFDAVTSAAEQAQPATESALAEARMRTLHDTHARPLYRYLLGLTRGERQAAEDLLQETLVRAWCKIDDLNVDVATLRPWLFTVARRIAIDAARARSSRPAEARSVDLLDVATRGDDLDRVLARQTIRPAMAALSPEHREVIVQIYFRDRSASQAAAVLGIPEGTVKSRTYYALRCLRVELEKRRHPIRNG